MTSVHIIERYRRVRERLKAARMRGEDEDALRDELDALWTNMSPVDRRTVLGVGVDGREEKRAAA